MEELKTHSVISLVDPGKGKDKGDDDGEHQVASLYLSLPIPTFLPLPVKPSCKCNSLSAASIHVLAPRP